MKQTHTRRKIDKIKVERFGFNFEELLLKIKEKTDEKVS